MLCAHQSPYTGCTRRHIPHQKNKRHFWGLNLWNLRLGAGLSVQEWFVFPCNVPVYEEHHCLQTAKNLLQTILSTQLPWISTCSSSILSAMATTNAKPVYIQDRNSGLVMEYQPDAPYQAVINPKQQGNPYQQFYWFWCRWIRLRWERGTTMHLHLQKTVR